VQSVSVHVMESSEPNTAFSSKFNFVFRRLLRLAGTVVEVFQPASTQGLISVVKRLRSQNRSYFMTDGLSA
jgi:hypothetical protein